MDEKYLDCKSEGIVQVIPEFVETDMRTDRKRGSDENSEITVRAPKRPRMMKDYLISPGRGSEEVITDCESIQVDEDRTGNLSKD